MACFGVDIGHNCPPDIGAFGIKFEDDLNREVGEKVISRLSCLGHKVIRCNPVEAISVNDSLRRRAFIANMHDTDVNLSIHFNASRSRLGRGSEVFYISPAGKNIAIPVQENLVQLGFKDRGVKYGSWYFLKNTKAPAILIEVAFCDNAGDMELLEKVGCDAIANAITAGLTI